MLRYNIQLRTIKDFRSFVNMNARFHIAGYVTDETGYRENMYEVLEILSRWRFDNLTLELTRYREEEIPDLEEYLSVNGLLREKKIA